MERLFKEHEWANGEASDYTLGDNPPGKIGVIGKPGLEDAEVLLLYIDKKIESAINDLETRLWEKEYDY